MNFKVNQWVFDKLEDVCFGIIIARNIKNSKTFEDDSKFLETYEKHLKSILSEDNIKEYTPIKIYREAMRAVGVNPNNYKNSLEAMSKRIIKHGFLPRINALVDYCNAISIKEMISLGAHDLTDFRYDFEVGLSEAGDTFKPFGSDEFEIVPQGELVFKNGTNIQTRRWLWRQSEHGKISEKSEYIIFQLVGFKGEFYTNFLNAMKSIECTIVERFDGSYTSHIVDKENPTAELL